MFLILATALQIGTASAAVGPKALESRAPLQNYVTSDDYPVGLSGSAARPVGVTLTVGPDGRVTQCLITGSSGAAQLDQATCRLLRSRARFRPARDAAGAAVPGEVKGTIDWAQVPLAVRQQGSSGGIERITLAPWESISRLRARLGQVASCSWSNAGVAPPPPSSNACQSPGLARMALGMAAENKVDFATAEVIVTLRMTAPAFVEPSPAKPSALVDLAAELEVGADGRLTGCRFLREQVHTSAKQRPKCEVIFGGPYIAMLNRAGQPIASKHRAELRVEAR